MTGWTPEYNDTVRYGGKVGENRNLGSEAKEATLITLWAQGALPFVVFIWHFVHTHAAIVKPPPAQVTAYPFLLPLFIVIIV